MDNPDQEPRQIRAASTSAALEELRVALTQASEELDADRRRGWMYALDALWRFLDTLDRYDRDRTKVPIATLMAALQDLDLGKVDPGLRPPERRGRGRAPDGYDVTVTRAAAAAWMGFISKALCDDGQSKTDADKEAGKAVADVLIRNGVRLGHRGNDTIDKAGRTVEDWREYLEEGRGHPKAVECYQLLKKKNQYASGTPAERIEAELKVLLPEALASRPVPRGNFQLSPVFFGKACRLISPQQSAEADTTLRVNPC
jgi:hypothetical protein